jgi:hypothetical protein
LTAEKHRKHEAQDAQTGHSFVAFVCSCFLVHWDHLLSAISGFWLCSNFD